MSGMCTFWQGGPERDVRKMRMNATKHRAKMLPYVSTHPVPLPVLVNLVSPSDMLVLRFLVPMVMF